jgi:hypothetical protein
MLSDKLLKRHKLRLLLCLLLLAIPVIASAAQPDLKGIYVGQSLSEFDEAHGGCIATRGEHTNMCYIPATEFGVGIYVRITVFFVDEKCVGAIVSEIEPSKFDQVVEGLTAKFGKSGQSRTFAVSNRLGARFTSKAIAWNFGSTKVTAEKYADSISESMVELYSPGMDVYNRRMKGSAAENGANM